MKNNLTAIIIGTAIIISIFIAAHAYKYRSTASETIVVTGLAEKDFNSNLIVWSGAYSRKSTDLKSAYAALRNDEKTIRNYLLSKGVKNDDIIFSSVNLNKDFSSRFDPSGRITGQEFTGYNLQQNITVQSAEIDKIVKISREITELIETGIELNSYPPAYYNTKLSQVKMDLLGQASADAKKRAEIIAKNAGSNLGNLKKASMGVFQITGKNSNENYSYGGAFNTANREKTGSITIRMEFGVN